MQSIAQYEEFLETVRGDIQHLVPQAAKILRAQPKTQAFLRSADCELSSALEAFERELVHTILRRALLSDVELEIIFTGLRNAYLHSTEDLTEHNALMASLAAQCFNNDYVWTETPEERLITEQLAGKAVLSESDILKLAMYTPLTRLKLEKLEPHLESSDPEFRYVISKQLREPLLEQELQESIPSLGKTVNPTSIKVAAQYQERPYPRWFSIPQQTTETLSDRLSSWCPEAFCGLSSDILVAGCGSGQHPIHLASTFPDSQVIGLDLSLPSLAYGKRRATEFGLSNVDFRQGDLLNLDKHEPWREKFGFVDAVGVLHHLSDPSDGCRALTHVMAPGALARIGLYSSRARRHAGITRARQSLEGNETLQEAREKLLRSDLSRFLDLFTLNGFRDLIFPAQETSYSLPEAVEMLRKGGLKTVGLQIPRALKARFLEEFTASLTDWEAWDSYEQRFPSTFAGMFNLLAVVA